jgi:hypothetical protein
MSIAPPTVISCHCRRDPFGWTSPPPDALAIRKASMLSQQPRVPHLSLCHIALGVVAVRAHARASSLDTSTSPTRIPAWLAARVKAGNGQAGHGHGNLQRGRR